MTTQIVLSGDSLERFISTCRQFLFIANDMLQWHKETLRSVHKRERVALKNSKWGQYHYLANLESCVRQEVSFYKNAIDKAAMIVMLDSVESDVLFDLEYYARINKVVRDALASY